MILKNIIKGIGIISLIYLVSCASELACNSMAYDQTLKHGLENNKIVKNFNLLYPDSSHSIGYFTGNEKLPPRWISKVIVYGRYRLTMHLPITHSMSGKILKNESPIFYLREITEISLREDKSVGSYTYGEQFEFDEDKWNQLVQEKGDFSVIGIHLEKYKPIVGLN